MCRSSFLVGANASLVYRAALFDCSSLDALRAERIIPRTPSPTPLEDRPVETLSAQELKELVRRQKVCQQPH